jgi:hypothetical protein
VVEGKAAIVPAPALLEVKPLEGADGVEVFTGEVN